MFTLNRSLTVLKSAKTGIFLLGFAIAAWAPLVPYIQARLEMCYNRFEQLNNKRQSITPGTLCQPRQQVLQQQQQRLQNTVAHLLEQSALQLQHRAALAHSLSPYQVLARGYGIPTTVKGKSLTVDEIKEKQRFYLQGYQQKVLCYAEQVEEIEETP